MKNINRTPVREKVKELSILLKKEQPDYDYLSELFRHLRKELSVVAPKKEKNKKCIPLKKDIEKFYNTLKNDANIKNKIIVQTLFYTGVRVSELINIKLTDISFDKCQIHIQKGIRGHKRTVFFPNIFKEVLQKHAEQTKNKGGVYLFESSWKKPFTDRGIRKMMSLYSKQAGLENPISPNTLRTFLLSWLKQQGIEDEALQVYSGHENRYALEYYNENEDLGIEEIQSEYELTILKLPFL